jgi:signal transduction histidine kinase
METLQKELKALRQEELKAYRGLLVAHGLKGRLRWIAKKSELTLKELDREQVGTCERQRIIIAKAYEAAQHAANLEGLLKLEQEKPQPMLLNIQSEVLTVLRELAPYKDDKGVEIVADLHDLEPVLLNKEFTVQALTNVIHNAIKYSYRDGVVKVLLRLEEGEIKEGTEKRKIVCVTVEDTGEGIKKELQEAIFRVGDRGDSPTTSGSGLGLYYARELSRLQGGDVVLVDSEVNRGSVFRIILPYESPPVY